VSYFNPLRALLKSATVPLIVVYTKFDLSVGESRKQLAGSSRGKRDDKSPVMDACSNTESGVQKLHTEITRLAGESLPYAAVSSKRIET
jgi:tRNA U34 5-carboxymethylaminomethyl modifying GTPase MnmE/TrmE